MFDQIRISIQISDIEEIVPSIFVALFESLFEIRLDGITRNASAKADKIDNINLVLGTVGAQVLQLDLSHIDASGIVNCRSDDICNLVEIFGEIARAVDLQDDGPIGGRESMTTFEKSVENEADFSAEIETRTLSPTPSLPITHSYSSPTRPTKPKRIFRGQATFRNDIDEFIETQAKIQKSDSGIDSTAGIPNDRPRRRRSMSAPHPATPDGPRVKRSKTGHQTPSVLKPCSSDTPHTLALKKRRAQLLRDYSNQVDRNETLAADMKEPHGPKIPQIMRPESSLGSTGRGRNDASRSLDFEDDLENPQSLAKKNLQDFTSTIRQQLPITNDISSGLKRTVWKKQVSMWKKALESRKWQEKVNTVRKTISCER